MNENPNINYNNVMKNKQAYFETEQIQKILDYYYQLEDYETYLFFLTLYRTGRRVTELLGKPPFTLDKKQTTSNYKGLRPIDIHEKIQSINFEILKKQPIKTITKKGSERTKEKLERLHQQKKPNRILIPIDSNLYHLLKQYISMYKIEPEDRLFQFSRETANLKLKKAIQKTNIKMNLGKKIIKNRKTKLKQEVNIQPHLHMFRHTFVITMLKRNPQNPAALKIISDLVQHSSINMTTQYMQFLPKDKITILDKTFNQ